MPSPYRCHTKGPPMTVDQEENQASDEEGSMVYLRACAPERAGERALFMRAIIIYIAYVIEVEYSYAR